MPSNMLSTFMHVMNKVLFDLTLENSWLSILIISFLTMNNVVHCTTSMSPRVNFLLSWSGWIGKFAEMVRGGGTER